MLPRLLLLLLLVQLLFLVLWLAKTTTIEFDYNKDCDDDYQNLYSDDFHEDDSCRYSTAERPVEVIIMALPAIICVGILVAPRNLIFRPISNAISP